ncbi:MAG TPA: ATP-binding cassette domain-containing protein, partial [Myxococcota bacterium]
MSAPAPAALSLAHVDVAVAGHTILADVSLSFAADRVHAVIGRSGAGKSVLMKAAAGLLPIARGSVSVSVQQRPLVFVHQDPALLDTLDVRENIAFAVERTQLARADVNARVDNAVQALGLASVLHAQPA